MSSAVGSDALRFRLAARLLAGAEPSDQVGDISELLLEVALIALQPFEDVLPVGPPAAEAAMVSSASVVHGHLPSKRSRNVSMRSRARWSAAAHSSSRRRPAAVSSYVRFAGPGSPTSHRDVTRPSSSSARRTR